MGQKVIEQSIVNKLLNTERDDAGLIEAISKEIDEAGYLSEDWQKKYAQERIYQAVLKGALEKDEKIIIPKNGLIFSEVIGERLVYVKCKNCGFIGEPYSYWQFRVICGVILLVAGLLTGLLFFFATSPYICQQCNERDGLIKILNNRKEIPIIAVSKDRFEWLSILLLILPVALILMRIFF